MIILKIILNLLTKLRDYFYMVYNNHIVEYIMVLCIDVNIV